MIVYMHTVYTSMECVCGEEEVVAEDEDKVEVGGEDEIMDEEVLSDKEQVLDVAMNPGGAPTQPL